MTGVYDRNGFSGVGATARIMVNAIVNPLQYAESRRKRDLSLKIGTDNEICETLCDIEIS